jgi:hypothetical protein
MLAILQRAQCHHASSGKHIVVVMQIANKSHLKTLTYVHDAEQCLVHHASVAEHHLTLSPPDVLCAISHGVVRLTNVGEC